VIVFAIVTFVWYTYYATKQSQCDERDNLTVSAKASDLIPPEAILIAKKTIEEG